MLAIDGDTGELWWERAGKRVLILAIDDLFERERTRLMAKSNSAGRRRNADWFSRQIVDAIVTALSAAEGEIAREDNRFAARKQWRSAFLEVLTHLLVRSARELPRRPGAPRRAHTLKPREALAITLADQFEASGLTKKAAALNVAKDARLKTLFRKTSSPEVRIRRLRARAAEQRISEHELRSLAQDKKSKR